MNLKKIEEGRGAIVSRLRTLCLRERMLGGTVTRTMVGNSLRMTVTDRVDGTTRTLFVPTGVRGRLIGNRRQNDAAAGKMNSK